MVGETLDRYRIESKLGEGGMGVVYKARDTHLDRVVAIKVLPADKVADPDRKQRFVQEAKAASALNHPGIVTIHDIRSDARHRLHRDGVRRRADARPGDSGQGARRRRRRCATACRSPMRWPRRTEPASSIAT